MSIVRTASLLIVVLSLAACGSTPPASGTDSGTIVLPDSGAPACSPPLEPYGTSEGRNLRPFTLNRCDGTPYEFYGEAEGFCDATFTVLTMAAEWCVPCQNEAAQLQTTVADAYADRGVRVVQVMIQDASGAAPSPAVCQNWVDTYGLEFPELLDPAQITQVYFPAGSLPATLIVDSHGVIRHREYGVSANLETMTAALDRLLAEAM